MHFAIGTVRGGGVIYRFGMSPSRKTLGIDGPLADGVADNSSDNLLAEQPDIITPRPHRTPGATMRRAADDAERSDEEERRKWH